MWAGRAFIGRGWAVFHGSAGDNAPHRHHAVQVVVGLSGPVEASAECRESLRAPAIVIAADCHHQLMGGPAPVALLYLERESDAGRVLDDWCDGGLSVLSEPQREKLAWLLANSAAVGEATLDEVLTVILGSPTSPSRAAFHDERIARSIAALPRPLPDTITVSAVAKEAGLSPSRYAHLFRAHAGMPLRPYLRWQRLQQALAEVAAGANLTEAAHRAGFADSAHLSRSFRRTFGISPRDLLHPALSLHASAR